MSQTTPVTVATTYDSRFSPPSKHPSLVAATATAAAKAGK